MATTLIKQRKPNEGEFLMGLENLEYVLFPDCETVLEIPMIRGKYNLGLTEEQQKTFEDYFNVKFDSPEGVEFLSNYQIVLRHDVNPRDDRKMEHLFDLLVLKANNGMGAVQFTEDPNDIGRLPFVATNEQKESEEKMSKNQTRNKALSELEKLSNNKAKLTKVCKYIFDLNTQDLTEQNAYNRLDAYIMGGQAEKFLHALTLDADYVDTVVTVKDAMTKGVIRLGQDQWYVNHANQTKLGRNLEEVVNYLSNPQNQDQLGIGNDKDLPYAIKRQLKERLN